MEKNVIQDLHERLYYQMEESVMLIVKQLQFQLQYVTLNTMDRLLKI